jgi:hypothetical protein
MHFSAKIFGKWAMALWKDSVYQVSGLETELRGAFGNGSRPSTKLFGDAGAIDEDDCRRSAIRVAVTSTTAFHNSPVLMSNYNREEQPKGNSCVCEPSFYPKRLP